MKKSTWSNLKGFVLQDKKRKFVLRMLSTFLMH